MKKFIKYFLPLFLFSMSCAFNISESKDKTSATKTEQFTIKTEDISYYPDKKEIKGFIAYPEKPGKYPALILIHEWWGLNDNIKDTAKKFSRLGYVAMAADLYGVPGTTDMNKARELAGAVRNNTDEALKNLKNGVNFLKARSDVNPDRIASVGWCFGGGWSYQMAKNDLGVKATVMYYGNFNTQDDLKMMKSHIIGHFGEKDTSIKVDDVKQFQATLKTLSGAHEIYIYPNAGHGFANETGAAYVKEAADIAWERTVEFLKKNL
jgi:carboxymethylenebutenolidase